ncbi:FtsK/SpoIIIE domain-containing protein [Clostridium sp. Marseille-QA1073]
MFVEFGIAGSITYFAHKYRTRDIESIKNKWYRIMEGANLYSKNNETYKIEKVDKYNFGYRLKIRLNDGLTFKKLEGIQDTLMDNYGCIVEIKKLKNTNLASVDIVTNPLNNLDFAPIKTKPYEVFLGYDFKGYPVLLNLTRFPHLLIAGVTGSGKSRVVFSVLTNLIHNFDERAINIYLAQVKKADLRHFKHCEQVKMYARTLEDTLLMFSKINTIIDRRIKLLEEADVENIGDYNRKSKNKFMKYIYVSADEFSYYMPDSSDAEDIKTVKEKALKELKDIILAGRSVGVFVICSLQRTTVDNMPSTIKSQMTRLSFRQISSLNSNNILESDAAVGLDIQEAVLLTNEYIFLRTATIDDNIMRKYLPQLAVKEVKVEPKQNLWSQQIVNVDHVITGEKKEDKIIPINPNMNKQFIKKKKRSRGVIVADGVRNA